MENMEETKETPVEATVLPESGQKVSKKTVKLNKKAIIIVAIVVVLGVLAYFVKGFFVAATVNGSPISRWSVLTTLEKESGKDLLDSLVIEKLIAGAAKDQKIVVSKGDIDAEIKKIETQVTAQGGTFEAALAQQGMTLDVLQKQILLQKQVEGLLADKIAVSDEEVNQYITDNKTTIPAGQEATAKEQIKSDLVSQKLNTEAPGFIADLKATAKINYFVDYK
jgi:hypothetical protein